MRLYTVGGAVRDRLMGQPASDRDWVAVGATPEQLLAAGYKPVGKDFPVFLHPTTGEEVALARTERKSGRGYHGFTFHAAPEVTLEQDLARRDLTINAMAEDDAGHVIDPYGGQRDLAVGLLRHVSPAFVEDPVRLLRVARFAARWPQFSVAPETMALLQRMVAEGEVDALVSERVWQELARGLMAQQPSRLFDVLATSGALPRLLPGLRVDDETNAVIDAGARAHVPLPVRFACLGWPDAGTLQTLCERLRVPVECREAAELHLREAAAVDACGDVADAEAIVALFERCDAWRRPDRIAGLLQARQCCRQGLCDRAARVNDGDQPPAQAIDYAPARTLPPLLAAAQAVNTAEVSARALAAGARGPAIGAAVRAARVATVAAVLAAGPQPSSA